MQYSTTQFLNGHRLSLSTNLLLLSVWCLSCGGPAPLLLCDLWNDPYCLDALNDERPDLVEKYTKFLEAQWEAHQVLRQHVGGSTAEVALTPEQLETLRALGYIQ